MNRLLNKVAIITGADGGICGKARPRVCLTGTIVRYTLLFSKF